MSVWEDDLKNLLGSIGNVGAGIANSAVPQYDLHNLHDPINSPFDVLKPVTQVMSIPQHLLQSGVGAGAAGLANIAQWANLPGDQAGRQAIIDAYTQGGGQMAWNADLGLSGKPVQAAGTLVSDPLLFTEVGALGKVSQGLRDLGPGGEALATVGDALGAVNKAPGFLIAKPARALVTGAKRGIDAGAAAGDPTLGVLSKAVGYSKQTEMNLLQYKLEDALHEHATSVIHTRNDPLLAGIPPETFLSDRTNAILDADAHNAHQVPPAPGAAHPPAPLSTGDVLQKNLQAARSDFRIASTALGQDPAYLGLHRIEDKISYAETKAPGVVNILKKWNKDAGIDAVTGDPLQAAVAAYMKPVKEAAGIKASRPNALSIWAGIFKEGNTATPGFHFRNWVGGTIMNGLSGYGTPENLVNPGQFLDSYRTFQQGFRDPESVASVAYQLPTAQGMAQFGQVLPPEVVRGGIVGRASKRGESNIGALAGKITRSDRVAHVVGGPFRLSNDIGGGLELQMRSVPYEGAFRAHMLSNDALPRIENLIHNTPGGQNVSLINALTDEGRALGDSPQTLHPADVYAYLVDQGMATGDAEHLSREVAREINIGKQLGTRKMQEFHFSYNKTNFDEFLGKFVPFSYWATRALPKYSEEALKHPTLLLNYMRSMQAAQDAQNDPGLSARQKGYIAFLSTPQGFTALLDPVALYGVSNVYDTQSDFTPTGQTELGGALSWMKKFGIGTYPWIDQTLNMMGAYGDTFEPDYLSLRQKALIGAAVNTFMAYTGHPPVDAGMANLMGDARAKFSAFISQFTPDWAFRPVAQKAGGSVAQATMDKAIEDRVISNWTAEHPGQTLTNGEALLKATDTGSADYQRAFREVATSGLAQQLFNINAPVSIKIQQDQPDVWQAQSGAIRDAATQAGVAPFKFTATMGDAQFMAHYKDVTGKDFQPGDYEDAKLKSDLAAAPDQLTRQFIFDEYDYNHLGSADEQAAFHKYQDLKNGVDPLTLGQDAATRRSLALQWLDQTGNQATVNRVMDLQAAFRATHPDYDQYKQWSDTAYQYWNQIKAVQGPDAGLQQYRDAASAVNPNAKAFFDRTWQYIVRTQSDPAKRLQLFDDMTISPSAYRAITGQALSRYDAPPVPLAPNQLPNDAALAWQAGPYQAPRPYTPEWIRAVGAPNNRYGAG